MLGRVFPGTVADRLLAGGTCPVAVAPREFSKRDARLTSIAVGLDGTAESRIAVAAASEVAQATGACLNVICVFDSRDPVQVAEAALGYSGLVAREGLTRQRVDQLWSMARRVVREMPHDVAATINVVEGDPAAVLNERSDDFDLLVLGSHRYGPVGRLLTGSVSSAVLRASRCPVLVAPRPGNASETSDRPRPVRDDLGLISRNAAAND
jgi:nucleotide-binding universal stress UspA family protein